MYYNFGFQAGNDLNVTGRKQQELIYNHGIPPSYCVQKNRNPNTTTTTTPGHSNARIYKPWRGHKSQQCRGVTSQNGDIGLSWLFATIHRQDTTERILECGSEFEMPTATQRPEQTSWEGERNDDQPDTVPHSRPLLAPGWEAFPEVYISSAGKGTLGWL